MVADARIDAYIDKSADFAKPILKHLREVIHSTSTDIEEGWKWSFPNFMYKGQILCSMAAFKNHCSFGFWKASLMPDPEGLFVEQEKDGMGHFGKITSLKDLPKDSILKKYIKEAMRLTDEGAKVPKKPKADKEELIVPDYLTKALQQNKQAKAVFDAFSYSNKKDYVEWLTEAKTEATRDKRMAQALDWMAEGKTRHWKYQK